MKASQAVAILITLASLLLPLNIRSELIGYGPYCGYYTVDRWGHKVFHTGPYHWFVSDEAAKALEKYKGKPIEITVAEFGPGLKDDPTIAGIKKLAVKGEYTGLILSIATDSAKVVKGEGLKLRLTIENRSDKNVAFHPGILELALVTDSPFSNKDIGYKHPDNISYWYFQAAQMPQDAKKGGVVRVACHPVELGLTAKDIISKGLVIRKPDDERKRDFVEFQPGGKLEIERTIGKELLPDDYEVFLYLDTGNFSHVAGPMSERLPFDVIENKPSVICAKVAPGEDEKTHALYDDDDYQFVFKGFGSGGKKQTPGLHVFSKKSKTWVRIDKVSTKGGTFGRSPTFDECKAAGKLYPSVGWNYSKLAEQDYAQLPLHTSGSILFPDKVTRDKEAGEISLHFSSNWEIKGVETILKFKESDLQKAFEDAAADGKDEKRPTDEE